jgi:hypothetical protein
MALRTWTSATMRRGMTRYAKLLDRLLGGSSDRSFRFDDLCILLERLGFAEHRRPGSHRIFTREDIAEILNLQPRRGGEAKSYQVRQVRDVVLRYGLAQSQTRALDTAETDNDA